MNWFLLALGAGYLYLTYQLPGRRIAGDPGIKLMPYVIGVLTVAFSLYHIARDRGTKGEPLSWRSIRGAVVASLIMLAYVGLMNPLGFELSTALFLTAATALFRRPGNARAWGGIVVFAIATTAAISLLFGEVFNVNLPDGQWLAALRG